MSGLKGVDGQSIEYLKTTSRFDYTSLPSSAAEFLRVQVGRIRRQAATSIINVGKDLIAAKRYLSHGLFVSWVEAEVGIPARTAQAYMQVAHWSVHKSATVALLPPSVLYLLSSPRTPQSFVADVLRRVELGERIALPVIRNDLKRLRDAGSEENASDATATQAMTQRCERQGRSIAIESDAIESDAIGSDAIESDPAMDLRRAVAILARGLSTKDFSQVRQIFTSDGVVRNRALGKTLATAFAEWNTPESTVRDDSMGIATMGGR